MTPQKITEEQKVHPAWYEEARQQTVETLPAFIKKLSEDYEHDYGTICHAIAAGAIGAAWAVDRSPHGGITGFQAGAIMWEFILHWNYNGNRCGLRLLDYDKLLYPQYADMFEKTISQETMDKLQAEAKSILTDGKDIQTTHPDVLNHWKSLAEGNPPFGLTVTAK